MYENEKQSKHVFNESQLQKSQKRKNNKKYIQVNYSN